MYLNRIHLFLLILFTLCLYSTHVPNNANAQETGEWNFLGLQGREVLELRQHDEQLYAATDSGLYRKDIQSQDMLWTPLGLQDKRIITLLVFDADTIMAAAEFDTISLYRTTDGGRSWMPYQNGFGGESPETVQSLAQHPEQPDVIFATGADVIAKSTNRGRSWQISFGQWQAFATGLSFVQVDTANPDIIWAGGQNAIERAVIVKSEDGGASWQEQTLIGNEVSTTEDVAIHPDNSATVYAGMESFILKTNDGGQTWNEVLYEDGRFFFDVVRNPEHPHRMYAASWFKTTEPQPLIMYITDDGGVTWQTQTNRDVRFGGTIDMLYSNTGGLEIFYLGLDKGGVYKYTLEAPTSVDSDPQQVTRFRLGRNYPNPFNPVTVIPFSIPETGHISLTVYNILGQEVASLVDGVRKAGAHEVRLHAEALPSGAYYYRLKTEDHVATKRLLILR